MAAKKRRRAKQADAHVRVYGWELSLPAYRTLSTDARALLVEFRALYGVRENRVYMSVREAQARLGEVGQRRAQGAIKELVERGWVRVIEKGAFSRKTKKATVYALTNEPLTNSEGATAPKDYTHWTPRKFTVAEMTTNGSPNDYREVSEGGQKQRNSSQNDYCKSEKAHFTVVKTATQIDYQAERSAVLLMLSASNLSAEIQTAAIFCLMLAQASSGMRMAA